MDICSCRNHLVLYTSAVCNLKCVYCYIDKNPALVKIDNILDESFKGDYYFNFAKEMFPYRNQLECVELWGGEPIFGLDRVHYTVKKLIEHYTSLNSFFMSTNFTSETWCEVFFSFIEMLQTYSNRKFHFSLQLSLDGPHSVNDSQRGKGVTDKFISQMDKYIEWVNKILSKPGNNVTITAQFKPTLTSEIISDMIKDKNNIIEYYKFFDDIKIKFDNNISVDKNFADLYLTVPNTAVPSPNTKQDGKDFATFCRYCKEINSESAKYFVYFRDIMPFRPRYKIDYDSISYTDGCGACGSGMNVVGLLPYDYVSCCHNGFVNLITDYKTMSEKNKTTSLDFRFFMNGSNYLIRHKDEYKKYEKNVAFAYDSMQSIKIVNIAAMISLLAKNGQIDEKYKDTKEAQGAALFLQSCTAYCFRNNVATTGSAGMVELGILRLLLNGAREEIE